MGRVRQRAVLEQEERLAGSSADQGTLTPQGGGQGLDGPRVADRTERLGRSRSELLVLRSQAHDQARDPRFALGAERLEGLRGDLRDPRVRVREPLGEGRAGLRYALQQLLERVGRASSLARGRARKDLFQPSKSPLGVCPAELGYPSPTEV